MGCRGAGRYILVTWDHLTSSWERQLRLCLTCAIRASKHATFTRVGGVDPLAEYRYEGAVSRLRPLGRGLQSYG